MREFLAIERCDRCGAQALHAASKSGFVELLFCNHHYHRFEEGLLLTGWSVESNVSMLHKSTVPSEA